MIATAGIALVILLAYVWVRLELAWRHIDADRAAARHALSHITHGQMASVHCCCGESFTAMTEDMARRSWVKHRRQEVGT